MKIEDQEIALDMEKHIEVCLNLLRSMNALNLGLPEYSELEIMIENADFQEAIDLADHFLAKGRITQIQRDSILLFVQ